MSIATCTFRLIASVLCIGAFVLAGESAVADDAVTAAGEQYKVEFENEKVRVLRGTYAPGAKAAMHEHPDAVVFQVTGGHLMMTLANGETVDAEVVAGNVGWSDATMHEVTNVGDEPLEVIIVELKD
ncbi:MAG TPA: hypothetical protein VMO47_05420 [Rhodothermales bacterium]|nr:hypothetical protein [Rhodothermales bacterium]